MILSSSFNRCQKLTKKNEFLTMYKEGLRRREGPLLIYIRPNNLAYSRLGLSVPKRVGNAVKRNKIKRSCREAFRLSVHDFPRGLDILLTIRPHELFSLNEYTNLLLAGVNR